MLAAVIFEVAHTVFVTIAVHWGLGQHLRDLSPQNKFEAMKWISMVGGPAILSSACGRVSFALYLLRVVELAKKNHERVLKMIVIVQPIVNIATIIQIYAQCHNHPSAMWDPAVAAIAHCDSPNVQTVVGFIQSAINSLCDAILTLVPAIIVWNLQIDVRRKLALSALLTLSIFALVASIAKAVAVRNLSVQRDLTWNFVSLTVWISVENNVVIIASSIPTLRVLLSRRIRGSLTTNSARTPRENDDSGYDRTWESRRSFGAKAHCSVNIGRPRSLDDGESGVFILQPMSREDKDVSPGTSYVSRESEIIRKTTNIKVKYSEGKADDRSS
ncbi:hypothetical protein MBLNU459_g7779t1 [Dothideomycetes sp. NU459]